MKEIEKWRTPVSGIVAGVLVTAVLTGTWSIIALKSHFSFLMVGNFSWLPLAIAAGTAYSIHYFANAKQYWFGIVSGFLVLFVWIVFQLFFRGNIFVTARREIRS